MGLAAPRAARCVVDDGPGRQKPLSPADCGAFGFRSWVAGERLRGAVRLAVQTNSMTRWGRTSRLPGKTRRLFCSPW